MMILKLSVIADKNKDRILVNIILGEQDWSGTLIFFFYLKKWYKWFVIKEKASCIRLRVFFNDVLE